MSFSRELASLLKQANFSHLLVTVIWLFQTTFIKSIEKVTEQLTLLNS